MAQITLVLSTALAVGLLCTVQPTVAAAQEETSFELAGTATYIRHQNSEGVLSKIGFDDSLARKDATFRLQFGLAGKCISLESVNFPGHYLRHQNFWIVLSKNDSSPLFKEDATFCTKNPLPVGSQTMFESVNKSGFFISNVGGKLKILQSANTGDFRRNATFERRPATNTNRPDGTNIDPG
jgi:hypothetical protein